jgi:hypothetical protein
VEERTFRTVWIKLRARLRGAATAYNGIAMLAFSESAAMTTAKHKENAPKASDATTASINRGEATLALWPLKPCAPVNRVMAEIPEKKCAGESPAG